jgi:hypothetical protein
MIFLINWLEANLFMIFTTLCLLGIPAVMLYVSFRKRNGAVADKEKYEQEQSSQAAQTQSEEIEEVS